MYQNDYNRRYELRRLRTVSKDKILRPILFTLAVSVCIIALCTIWECESRRGFVNYGEDLLSYLPNPFMEKKSGILQNVSNSWKKLPKHEQIYWPIFFANLAVFFAWQIPSLYPTMVKWFCTTNMPGHPVALPMLLSVFSHASLLHLSANMSTLHSVSPFAAEILGREMFLAFFLIAGVVSSLGSYVHQVVTGRYFRSLGASGAICAIIAFTYNEIPDLQVKLFFLPTSGVPAATVVQYLLIFDTFCLLTGQHYCDHAAHIAGYLFGLYMYRFGNTPISYLKGATLMLWGK